ncbi:MAG: hypothetical protein CMM61_17045 [Rhodospirillaceae bacterium]|nr:hypothetical protein [Rhodospirillaceae bacterium]
MTPPSRPADDTPLDPHLDPHLDAAMDWLLRVNERPEDTGLRSDLDAWLDADPAHQRAFQLAGRTWQMLGEATPFEDTPKPPDRVRESSGRRPALAAAGLALAACLAFAVVPDALIRAQADFRTKTAEARQITLDDGTRVDLAPETAIAVTMTAEVRRITLLRGEAFFKVTPDAARPFTVENGGVEARVLGTAFNVRTLDDFVAVQVAEGRVRVTYGDGTDTQRADLMPGQGIRVARAGGDARADDRAPKDIALWRSGMLFVADASVAEVAAIIDRYQPGWVLVADAALAQARVNGLYDLADPARALRALVKPAGGSVTRVSPFVHVLTGP